MKKRKILTVLAIVTALAIPASVFAATSNTPVPKAIRSFLGIDTSKLTDTQKAAVTDYTQKAASLQKDFINKMVANGSMTKEQGDAQIAKIDDAVKNGTFSPGGWGGKFGKKGDGGQFGLEGIDLSKLTDAQKADLTASNSKITNLQKNLVDTLVSDSLITKTQGDTAKTNIDNKAKNQNQKEFGEIDGIGCLELGKIDTSKLTDKQKTDLTDYAKNAASVQKEIINKLVADNVITKAQGDTAISKIDTAVNNGDILKEIGRTGFKGHGYGRGHGGENDENNENNPTSQQTPATSTQSSGV